VNKIAFFIIFAVIISALSGCAKKEENQKTASFPNFESGFSSTASGSTDRSYIPEELSGYFGNTRDDNTLNPLAKFIGNNNNFPPAPFKVDIDFTKFSGPEFDETFSNMLILNPQGYMEKTVRLIGPYIGNYFEDSGRYMHFVLIDDALGCCFRFVELELGESFYSGVYTENYSIIDVAGEFSSYYEKAVDWNFNFLKVGSISVLGGSL
jgi:hypothetical protein